MNRHCWYITRKKLFIILHDIHICIYMYNCIYHTILFQHWITHESYFLIPMISFVSSVTKYISRWSTHDNYLSPKNVVLDSTINIVNQYNTFARPLRRSVRNALFLLPLLGITNAITMIPKPLERSAFEFGIWSYSTNILTSFQGFVVACIYCFFNADVSIHR